LLFVVNRAYREFAQAVESREAGPGKTELVREVVMGTEGDFSLSQIKTQLPSVSEQLIKKVLQQLKTEGHLRLTGHGRSARWEKVD
ncbi:MAG: cell filamentation protein Fic, partial [Deltaproteobacteria bacterium]|nr:cell filamentation protein Fic [Deltaproteobacteria bacterium]